MPPQALPRHQPNTPALPPAPPAALVPRGCMGHCPLAGKGQQFAQWVPARVTATPKPLSAGLGGSQWTLPIYGADESGLSFRQNLLDIQVGLPRHKCSQTGFFEDSVTEDSILRLKAETGNFSSVTWVRKAGR